AGRSVIGRLIKRHRRPALPGRALASVSVCSCSTRRPAFGAGRYARVARRVKQRNSDSLAPRAPPVAVQATAPCLPRSWAFATCVTHFTLMPCISPGHGAAAAQPNRLDFEANGYAAHRGVVVTPRRVSTGAHPRTRQGPGAERPAP